MSTEPTAGAFDPSGASIVPADEYDAFEIGPGRFFRLVEAEHMTFNFVTFPPNGGFDSHSHPEEQVSIVYEGSMELTIGETTRTVRPGDVFHIPGGVPHSGRTFDEGCRVIDAYSPARPGLGEMVAGIEPRRAADVDPWWQDR